MFTTSGKLIVGQINIAAAGITGLALNFLDIPYFSESLISGNILLTLALRIHPQDMEKEYIVWKLSFETFQCYEKYFSIIYSSATDFFF